MIQRIVAMVMLHFIQRQRAIHPQRRSGLLKITYPQLGLLTSLLCEIHNGTFRLRIQQRTQFELHNKKRPDVNPEDVPRAFDRSRRYIS
ncbi:MAG: hypothetical protein LH605_08530 [Microbacteriaceae bacterium]|nr:hypothetical protein [Microbacteriaceae bacterium]